MNGRQNDAVAAFPASPDSEAQTQTALNPQTLLNFIAGSQS